MSQNLIVPLDEFGVHGNKSENVDHGSCSVLIDASQVSELVVEELKKNPQFTDFVKAAKEWGEQQLTIDFVTSTEVRVPEGSVVISFNVTGSLPEQLSKKIRAFRHWFIAFFPTGKIKLIDGELVHYFDDIESLRLAAKRFETINNKERLISVSAFNPKLHGRKDDFLLLNFPETPGDSSKE